jgi:predicted transposase YbfD/YdcC
MTNPISYFSSLPDPRVERTRVHLLEDIIFITIAAVISGAETWNQIADYGKSKVQWLRQYLQLPAGIPSHDTFNRFFSALNPQAFEQAFLSWVNAVVELTEGSVVSIDGKTLCGSLSKDKRAIHIVSAWSSANQLSLGQVKVDEKSNEITAIPRLLEVLALKGCIVTIDAMGCQREIAKKIIEKEADYILAVKGNQGVLEENVKDTVRFTQPVSQWTDLDSGHGRIEIRNCSVYQDLSLIENASAWESLYAVIKIDSYRYIKCSGKEQWETRYYITSSQVSAEKLSRSIRSHWGIENELHYQLDVSFHEDNSRKREGNAAQNFSMINRIALSLIKNEKSKKSSVSRKRLQAGWDNDYLLKILKN